MKHFLLSMLFFALAFATAEAQTISVTNTSVELIGSNSVTRSFYDLDKCYLTYNNGIVKLFDAAANTQLFSGDTTAVTVTSSTTWAAKRTALSRWYWRATDTKGNTFFLPRREVNYIYKTSDNSVKAVNELSKKILFQGPLDSLVLGVSGVSSKLAYLRAQQYLDGARTEYLYPETPTIAVGASAGTGATASIVGAANGFVVTITTGTSVSTTGTLATITLPFTYPNGIIPIGCPATATAGAEVAKVFYQGVPDSKNQIAIVATGTALTASTVYKYNVQVVGY
jgi:hypothetical protein